MIATNARTIIGLATATLAFSAPVLADCPVDIEHPEKVPFAVNMALTSDVNLNDPDEDACNNAFVKQVPIWNDGTFGYGSDCSVYSYGAWSIDDESQPESWADADAYGGMSGRVLDNGFRLDVVLDGYVNAYNGSTSVDAELNVAYRFTLEGDARFTFENLYHIGEGNDLDISVQLVDIERGLTYDWTDYFNEDEENAEPIAAGTYEIRVNMTYHQDGCDGFLFIGASEIEMRFYCPDSTRPGDINKDDIVNGLDLAILLGAFSTYDQSADLNQDGKVDGTDLTYLLSDWG